MVAGGGEGAVAAWEVAVIGGGAEGGKLGSEGVGSVAKGGGDMGAGRRRGWREPDSRMRCRDARRAQQFPNGVLLADTLKDASSSEQRLAMRAGFPGEGGGWRRRGLAGLGGGGDGRWVGRGCESANSKIAAEKGLAGFNPGLVGTKLNRVWFGKRLNQANPGETG